jgi:hypothetical protein
MPFTLNLHVFVVHFITGTDKSKTIVIARRVATWQSRINGKAPHLDGNHGLLRSRREASTLGVLAKTFCVG